MNAFEPLPNAESESGPSMKASLREGMASAAMLGAGETYLSAFAIFLQGTAVQIGVLGTAPQLCGALAQLGAVEIMDRLSRRRRLLIVLTVVQALYWLVIAAIRRLWGSGPEAVWVLIEAALGYYMLSGLITPIWSSLIGDLIPADIRGQFFGRRSRLVSIVTFAAMFAAGQLLELFKTWQSSAAGFALIFVCAGAARLLAAYYLARHADPAYQVERHHKFSLWDFVRRMPTSNFARFVLFVALVNASVWLAAPYFAVYMLRDLGLSYTEYTVLSAASVLAQIVTLQSWGLLTDRFGSKRILEFSVKGVVLCPFLWLFGSGLWYLIAVQLFAGFVWAGYNLAVSTFLFDAVTPPKRGRCVAYQSAVNGVFVLGASLLGGFLATHWVRPIPFDRWFDVPASNYLMIFLISGCLRALVVVLLLRIFKEVREVEDIKHTELIFRIAHVRPLTGLIIKPVVFIQNAARRIRNGDDQA